MTIHHDKMAYGRLKSLSDEMSADEIAKLVEELNDEDDEENEKGEENEENEAPSS